MATSAILKLDFPQSSVKPVSTAVATTGAQQTISFAVSVPVANPGPPPAPAQPQK